MNKAAQALGRLGGKAGRGKTKARPSAVARAAVNARWKSQKRRKPNDKVSYHADNVGGAHGKDTNDK